MLAAEKNKKRLTLLEKTSPLIYVGYALAILLTWQKSKNAIVTIIVAILILFSLQMVLKSRFLGYGKYDKWTYLDGTVYEGEWKDGNYHGQGKMTWSYLLLRLFGIESDVVYEGEWKDSKMHGQGKYTSAAHGTVYEGEWKNDNMHGQGKKTWYNGDVYEGEWKDDNRHGQGKYTWPSGTVYDGEWKDDNMHGQGEFTSLDGTFKGEVKEGKPISVYRTGV